MNTRTFLIWKPEFFRQVKEIKPLSGGVVLYAAQAKAQIDAEMAEKGGFRTETSYDSSRLGGHRQFSFGSATKQKAPGISGGLLFVLLWCGRFIRQ